MSLTKVSYSMITGAPVNALDFGADPTAATDSTSTIQAALDSLPATGGAVFLPRGVYKVTAPIFVRDKQFLFGEQGYAASQLSAYGSSAFSMIRVVGSYGGLSNLYFTDTTATISTAIFIAPENESALTTVTNQNNNTFRNIYINYLGEGIVMRPGGVSGSGQQSGLYYNYFENINIERTKRAIWMRVGIGAGNTSSGSNRNTFVNCRIGVAPTNTGVQIDAGDTNNFINLALEGIFTGTSPNTNPTGIKIADNALPGSYCNFNIFFGVQFEVLTRWLENDNVSTQLFTGQEFDGTNYGTATPAIQVIKDYIKHTGKMIGGSLEAVNTGSVRLNLNSATKESYVVTTSGTGASYNGTGIYSNSKLSDGLQANTALSSWLLDIGGTEPGNGVGVSDTFGIMRKAAGAGSWTTLLLGDSNGAWKPGTDNTQTLGTAVNRWSVVYAGTGAINTSDSREKQQVRDLSNAEQAVAVRCKSLLRAFKFNDAVAVKNDNARIHFGVMAQDVQAAFAAEGLNADNYALFCYDEWKDKYLDLEELVVLEDGTEEMRKTGERRLVRTAGNRFGVRYEELLCFIMAAI